MPPIDSSNGFFAGLTAGDGAFAIWENNGGQSWTCGLTIKLRDDDTPLLEELSRSFALGALYPVKASGRSRPQLSWGISRMGDCLTVSALFQRSPLISKKAGEFEIWQRAVEIWAEPHREPGWQSAIAELARRLREYRSFAISAPPVPGNITSDYLDHFLAGFATAEAHFGATVAGTATFVINLRADDAPVLEYLRDRLDVGYVVVDPPDAHRCHAVASWRVARRADVVRLVTQFDRAPPRGRKAVTYEAWRDLVLATDRTGGGPLADAAERRRLAATIRATRVYRRPDSRRPRHRNTAEDRRGRCTAALLAWATVEDSPLTATAYHRYRSAVAPDAPHRNTIARTFGSWRSALEACALPTAGCRSPATLASVRARRAGADRTRRNAQRAAIADAIRGCRHDLGRWPTASEFFRWRLKHLRRSPSQPTLYRVFVGGWAEALRAARGRVT